MSTERAGTLICRAELQDAKSKAVLTLGLFLQSEGIHHLDCCVRQLRIYLLKSACLSDIFTVCTPKKRARRGCGHSMYVSLYLQTEGVWW